MGFTPIQLQLPKLPTTQSLSNLGNLAKPAPKPEALQIGKGFSNKDSFEAAPQRAAAKPQLTPPVQAHAQAAKAEKANAAAAGTAGDATGAAGNATGAAGNATGAAGNATGAAGD